MEIGLLLLPGMDGTGRLFRPFIEQLPPDIWTKVVSYPPDRVLGYDDLLPLVEEQIEPSLPHVVVAESFSGPLAVEYTLRRRDDVAAIVSCGSFVRNPLPRGIRWLPKLVHPALVSLGAPPIVLRTFLLDFATPADQVAYTREVIRMVDPKVLVARMRAVAAVDVTAKLEGLQVPVLYIAAGRDRMIGARGADQIRAATPHAAVETLAGPHLILQTRPHEAVHTVLEFLRTHRLIAA